MWQVFSTNWRISAMIGIVVISGIGAMIIQNVHQKTQQLSTQAHTQAFRNSIAIMHDLTRLSDAADRFAIAELTTDERAAAQANLGVALDFLFVRTAQIRHTSDEPRLAVPENKLINNIQGIIDFSDTALQDPDLHPTAFGNALRGLTNLASHALLEYSDAQFGHTSSAIGQQDRYLNWVSKGFMALFALFAAIAIGSVFLLERQILANQRRQLAEQKAEYLAFYDTLTGLPRRDRFKEEATAIISRHERSMVLVMDIDDFKNINDLRGHAAGDASLRYVGNCLRDMAESHGGVAARLGGDEFAAVIPGPLSSMRAASICETLIAVTNKPFDHDNIQIALKVSIGIAFVETNLTEDLADDLSAILKSADVALYRSKEEGKNTYSFFDSHLADIVARRRDLEVGISAALQNQAFHLNYQPQVDLATGKLLGFEALARWTRDDEVISPGEFIPVAEATGQVVEIDIFAMRAATQQAVDWFRAGNVPVKISTNLSALHFRNDDIVDKVKDALVDSGLPPYLLTLEITESAMIEDVSAVIRILEKFKKLGVKTALDDFGTGYSSLAYLRMLDVDFIKIDQSFLRNLTDSSETQIVIESLVRLAKGLEKKLVVEGIETDAQRDLVARLGCDVGQGYLFGRPLPEEDARAMIPSADDALRADAG